MSYLAQVEKVQDANTKLRKILEKEFINIVCQDGNEWVMYVLNPDSIEVDTFIISSGPTWEDCILNAKL